MKRTALVIAAASLLAATHAQAFEDQGRVRRVQPHYERVSVPRQECTSQWVQEATPPASTRNYAGLAAGGVAGAVLGNQIGKGNGRAAATAVGAVVGALAGEHFANQAGWGVGWGPGAAQAQQPAMREVRSCRTVYDSHNKLTGYKVDYEYRGQVYQTTTREHPGRVIPVRVSVAPAERGRDRI